MELPGGKNCHFRHLLYYAFRRGKKASETARKICAVYGENSVSERTAQEWFVKFKTGCIDIEDAPRSGRPVELDEDGLKTLLKENSRQTQQELATKMGCSQESVSRHLASMGIVRKLGVWVPHALTDSQKETRLMIAAQHLARYQATRNHDNRFLHRIVTGDEKWCLYINLKPKADWVPRGTAAKPRVKQDLHPKKVMLCVWWDWEGLIYWELLEDHQTVTSELYVAQLQRVRLALQQKRPHRQGQVILLHDNARPHTARNTKAALATLEWEILLHPPYSPDLAPSDYHLFRSLTNHLRDRCFDKEEDLRQDLNAFFDSKPQKFWREGIHHLVDRWKEVVNNDGDYVINL